MTNTQLSFGIIPPKLFREVTVPSSCDLPFCLLCSALNEHTIVLADNQFKRGRRLLSWRVGIDSFIRGG
jgi:hypothetical protein